MKAENGSKGQKKCVQSENENRNGKRLREKARSSRG
jgi:hypothetical protein